MAHKFGLRLDITVTDKDGNITDTRHVESDIILRNFFCAVKAAVWGINLVAGDGQKDVTGVASNVGATATSLRGMTGTGVAAETSADFRIQTPLYTTEDTVSVGLVSLGGGNQVVVAVTSAHTFAGGATVTEAGLFYGSGSLITYLTATNVQVTRNTFAGVVVPPGSTFTSTYTFTAN